MVSAALAEADDGNWNVTNDPIYPACLEGFRRRHESSQASQANKSAERSGTGGGSPTRVMTPPSAASSQPLFTPTLGAHEIRGIIHDTLDQVYALCLKTLQEMGFIWEVDRALAKYMLCIGKTACFSVSCPSLPSSLDGIRNRKAQTGLICQSSLIKLHPQNWTRPHFGT